LVVLGLAAVSVAGCSSRSEGPTPPPANTAAAPSNGSPAASPPESAAAAPKQEERPSPYAGLEAQQVDLYERAEGLLEPVASSGAAAYASLKEAERRAQAVMKLGGFKVSLNRQAETRLRATLAEAKTAQAKGSEYAAAWKEVWPVRYDMEQTYQSRTVFPAREALTVAYERALDEGAEFSPEIRRALGEMARAEGVPDPEFQVDLTGLTELLRTKLLEQSVTGDHLFLMALAVRERGEDVLRRRNFSRALHGLVSALPPKHRTELLMKLAWDEGREAALDEQREALKAPRTPPTSMVLNPGADLSKVGQFRANAVEEVKKAYLDLEQGRRDAIEGYFRRIDEPGWQALVAFDGLLGEFQTILDTILPDLGYRFRPLIPPDAPRDVESNVLPKVSLPGSAADSMPTIDLRGSDIVFDAPAGKPKFNEVVKPGQVLVGTIRLRDNINQLTTIRGVELLISHVVGGQVSGELRIPKGREHESNAASLVPGIGDEEARNLPFSGSVANNTLSFSVNWNPLGGDPRSAGFSASMETGTLSGKITGLNGEGRFSFEPKK
jgi:hypothetical protein